MIWDAYKFSSQKPFQGVTGPLGTGHGECGQEETRGTCLRVTEFVCISIIHRYEALMPSNCAHATHIEWSALVNMHGSS